MHKQVDEIDPWLILNGDEDFLLVEDEGDDEPGRDAPDGLDEADPVRVHRAVREVKRQHLIRRLVAEVEQDRVHA